MEKKITVSSRFKKNALHLYDYLLIEFSAKTAYDFLDRLEKRIGFIYKHPHIGSPSRKKNHVRSVTLLPHNRIYYRLKDDEIVLLCIYDMRRDNSRNLY